MTRIPIVPLLGAALVLAVVAFAPPPQATLLNAAVHDVAHVVAFGFFGWWCFAIVAGLGPARSALPVQWFLCLAAGLLLGTATELVQGYTGGGDANGSDVLRDCLGTMMGASLRVLRDARAGTDRPGGGQSGQVQYRGYRRRTPRRRKWPWYAIAIACAVLGAWPAYHAAREYALRARVFPVLLAYGAARDPAFVQVSGGSGLWHNLPGRWATPVDPPALVLPLGEGRWPGGSIAEPFPDWRSYRTLNVDITNPFPQALELRLRVHDAAHDGDSSDRYTTTLLLPPYTRSQFAVPLAEIAAAPAGRPMDMARIAGVGLYHDGPLPGREVYLTRVWLGR